MNLPINGRVVVIDDVQGEGFPLLKLFSQNGIPVSYFTGVKEELPASPISGVRVIFLDIILGTESQSEKTKISTVANVVTHIVGSSKNTPYIIIAWTKHRELKDKIKDALKSNPPLMMLDLKKDDCKNSKGEYDLNIIKNRLKEEMTKSGVFQLFLIWENLVHQSANGIVEGFTGFYAKDGDWNKNMFCVFKKLAEAYAGKKLMAGKLSDIFVNSLLTFNMTFLDTLENEIKCCKYPDKLRGLRNKNIPDEKIIASVNTKLLLADNKDNKSMQPGNVYEGSIGRVKVAGLFDGDIDKYQNKADLISKAKPIYAEVSPICDYTCDKLKLHRILPGFLWPVDHIKKVNRKADYIYTSPLFLIGADKYYLVFDVRYLTSLPLSTHKKNKKLMFKLKHELLTDIQAHLANHINRPGVIKI